MDDGTGLIACNRWINDLSEEQILNQTSTFEHGDLVLVQGKLNTFRNEMKINIVNISKHLILFFENIGLKIFQPKIVI